MSAQDLVELRRFTLKQVNQIPEGRVMTYGQIASLVGFPGYARHVGHILFRLSEDSSIPWQRVVASSGKISTFKVGLGELQQALLEREGIEFKSGRMRLSVYLWEPETLELEKDS